MLLCKADERSQLIVLAKAKTLIWQKYNDMNNVKKQFHIIGYVQYPLMLIAVAYTLVPYFYGFNVFWPSINQALIFAGLGISFSTLQDTTKTQNDFSKRIWENPKKGTFALAVIFFTALAFLGVGLYGFYAAKDGIIKEVAFGTLMLGIGYIGLLKSAIEMFENHRKPLAMQ
jgi:hypothetical protein